MSTKGFNNFSWPLTVAVVFAVAVAGCGPRHVSEEEERGGRVTRTHPAQRAIGLGLGAMAVGAGALLGGGTKDQEQTEQQKGQTPEDTEQQRKEAEKAKNQY